MQFNREELLKVWRVFHESERNLFPGDWSQQQLSRKCVRYVSQKSYILKEILFLKHRQVATEGLFGISTQPVLAYPASLLSVEIETWQLTH